MYAHVLWKRVAGSWIASGLILGASAGTARSDDENGTQTPPPDVPAQAPALEERLRRLEEVNRKLLDQFEKVSSQNEALSKKVQDLSKKLSDEEKKDKEKAEKDKQAKDGKDKEKDDKEEKEKSEGGSGGSGGSGGGSSSGSGGAKKREAQDVGNRHLGKAKLKSYYDYDRTGYEFATEDDELRLRFRGMVQADARIYQQANQDPVNGGFFLPRTRFYFDGRITKPIEYQLSIQRGYTSLDVLNAYLDFKYDERFQLRAGRFKTPYTYEYYKINVYNLLAPERSLFNVNFQGNRQVGLMAHGQVFNKKLEYAVGAFDGPRKSYADTNNSPDVIAFLNFRPFDGSGSFLENLNVGGSVDFGNENNPTNPAVLRTSVQESSGNASSANAGVPILAFNQGVRERGDRALWDLHAVYYYKGLSLLGSWDGGFADYAVSGTGRSPVHLPVGGYYVQAGYILTGETINERTMIDPLHPFDLRPGKFGLGAFEATARFSELSLGK